MSVEVDVFAENFTLVDWDLYEMWIRGLDVSEAVSELKAKGILEEHPGVTNADLLSDVSDNYRLFSMLEHSLLMVGNFSEQLTYQMDPATQDRVIKMYWCLDSIFCRELLGKKLSSRVRKDLDDIAEKIGISLKSCRRQFDNVKRVFKAIEEMPGSYVPNIQKTFNVSKGQAEEYATIVFITSFRFEMSKKKLQNLSFDVIKTISLILIRDWMEFDEENEPSLDKDSLNALKELKVCQERDKEHRSAVIVELRKNHAASFSPRSLAEIENNFRNVTRNILAVGQGLSHSKEMRDFFIHLIEKIREPLRQMQLSREEVPLLLRAYVDALSPAIVADEGVRSTFHKFMSTLAPCITAVF